jgi:plasmanylethanolamine desaturase
MADPSSPSSVLPLGSSVARAPGWTEYAGVLGFFVLGGALSWMVLEAVALDHVGWVLGAAALGLLAADLLSGVVHWAFDTWGSPTTPGVGQPFIVPFRVHHSDPQDITRHGFIATNGHNCLAAVPVLALSLWLPVEQPWGAALAAFVAAVSLGTFGTNQFHKWAHQPQVSPFIAWLQRHHLVLNPEHHEVHHTRPFDQHYCITTGWLNEPLRKLGFFRGLERLISAATGAVPRRDDLDPASR